jgi:hypothetical protein
MVHPPQATESPSLSGLLDGTWADSSKYPYAAQAKAHVKSTSRERKGH